MSLRARLALGVALLVALGIALSGWFAVNSASAELDSEVDEFLLERVEQIRVALQAGRNGETLGDRSSSRGRPQEFIEYFINPDALTQVIGRDGTVLVVSSPALPFDDEDLKLAGSGKSGYRLRSVEIDGSDYRLISASGSSNAIIMVARDVGEQQDAVRGIARRTVLAGLVGAALAALAAWLFSSRFTKPINQLALAAEQVAETQDLSQPIEVGRSDEVGRLAGSFNTMLGALDTSRQQQRRLIMDASHELRTPLTSLRTNVEVLQRAKTMEMSDQQEILGDVSAELQELTTMVTELVDLATASQRPDEEVVSIDLNDAVRDAVEMARRRHGRGITVTAAGGMVTARESLLGRAINNLLDNAAKFSPTDAPIEVSISGGKVTVRDYGSGIAAEDQERVFDRFYRATATRTEPGSGLGLAIVKEVVTSHGGSVFVETPSDGVGAIVGFELPVTS